MKIANKKMISAAMLVIIFSPAVLAHTNNCTQILNNGSVPFVITAVKTNCMDDYASSFAGQVLLPGQATDFRYSQAGSCAPSRVSYVVQADIPNSSSYGVMVSYEHGVSLPSYSSGPFEVYSYYDAKSHSCYSDSASSNKTGADDYTVGIQYAG